MNESPFGWIKEAIETPTSLSSLDFYLMTNAVNFQPSG